MKKHKPKFAFTIIEMSVVLVLLGIISFFSIDFLIKGASKTAVANTSTDVVQFFKKVQNQNKIYGIPSISEGGQTYYGVIFERDADNQSSYSSFKSVGGVTQTLEVFHLPNNIYFSNFDLGETLTLKFCATMDYDLPLDTDTTKKGLEYLCDDEGTVCSEVFEIDVKSKFTDYQKKVFINTSQTQYSCVPEIYERNEVENDYKYCVAALGCINGVIYNNVCEFEGEIADFCLGYEDLGNNTCSCP